MALTPEQLAEAIKQLSEESDEKRLESLKKQALELEAQKKTIDELAAAGKTIVGQGALILEQRQNELETRKLILKLGKEDTDDTIQKIAAEERLLNIKRQGYNDAEGFAKRFMGITREPTSEFGKFLVDPSARLEGLTSGLSEVVDGMSIMTSAVDAVVQSTVALAQAQDQAIASFRQATGAGGEFDESIISLERDLFAAGVTAGEASQAIQSLFLNVSDFTEMLPSQQEELAKTVSILNELGVSTETTSKNIQFGTKVLGMSVTQAGALQRELATFAKDLGVSSQQIADDFTAMGPQIAALGSNGVDAFRKLQVQAKATGLQMSELLGIVEKFDKFDSAAQSVGRLNALLGGPYLNTLELVAETDPSKRFEILKNSVDQAGLSFDSMDYYQRKAIASAMGLNEQQLALMMRGNLSMISEPQKSAAEIEELAIRQKEFATMTDELAQTMMALAVSMRPVVDLIKNLLNLVQHFGQEIQIAVIAFSSFKIAAFLVSGSLTTLGVGLSGTITKLRAMGVAAYGALGPWGILIGSVLTLAGYLYVKTFSPGLITILGMASMALLALGFAASAFGFSLGPVLPFILAFAAALLMIGVGIGIASAGLGLMVSSLTDFGAGLAESMTITALAIADIVESINELDTTKTVAIGAVMAAGVVAAPAAALASVGVAAVTRGLGGGDTAAGAGGGAGPAPAINVHLSIDGTEFSTAVNKVEVEKYSGGGQSEMYSTIMDMISQGFVKGV